MKAKVLIIDDEISIRISLSEFLKRVDYEPHTAEDVDEAREILKEHDISIIVSDLILPKENGMALIKEVFEHKPETGIIVMTGHPTDISYMEAKEKYEVFDYLIKPVLKEDIIKVVNDCYDSLNTNNN